MTKRELLDMLRLLLQAVVEVETPKPRPTPPDPPQGAATIYQDAQGRLFRLDAQGRRHDLHFIPRGYESDGEGGYWRRFTPPSWC
jgi:hypothetical protein